MRARLVSNLSFFKSHKLCKNGFRIVNRLKKTDFNNLADIAFKVLGIFQFSFNSGR